MKKNFIISVFSKDRVGIIADVAQAILSLDGDLGDLSQAVLDGYFTMIFVSEFNKQIEVETLENQIIKNLGTVSEHISVTACELPEANETNSFAGDDNIEDNKYVMTVSSSNRGGLVAEVAGFLKENQINIINLASKLSHGDYTMMYLLDLSAISFVDVLREKIKDFANEKDLHIVLQHNDIFRATNEIKYYKQEAYKRKNR